MNLNVPPCPFPKPLPQEKKKKRGIAPRSKNRAKQEREYSKLRVVFLKDNPFCKVGVTGCAIKATQIHHRRGRLNDRLLEVQYFLPTCACCHDYVELHPEWAKDNGYSVGRLTK